MPDSTHKERRIMARTKYRIDPKFKKNIGGFIWRRQLKKGAGGDYWDYFISNIKETYDT